MINIGDSIILADMNTDAKDTYRSKVIDRNEYSYFVDYPINTETKKSEQLSLAKQYSISYINNNNVYAFTTKIYEYEKLTVPALAIPIPEKNNIRKIQRREFVRVKTNCDIAIHCPDNSFLPIVSVTADISGGGAAIVLSEEMDLSPRKQLNIYLVLRFEKGKYEYINTSAQYVRTAVNNGVQILSVKFIFDNNVDQEKIIQYCFHVQREERKQNITP